jgi:hypothetical protein
MKSAASSLGKLGQMCMSFQFSTPLYERICCDLRNRRAFLLDTSTQPSGDDEFMNRLPFGYLMTASKFDTLFTLEWKHKLLHGFVAVFLVCQLLFGRKINENFDSETGKSYQNDSESFAR